MPSIQSLTHIKRQAKHIKKADGITHARALDAAAQASGFHNYRHAQRQLKPSSRETPTDLAVAGSILNSAAFPRECIFSARALALMKVILRSLVEFRSAGHIARLSLESIREYLPMDKLRGLLDHPKLSDKTKRELRTGYLQMLPGYKDQYPEGEERLQAEMLNQHGYGVSLVARFLSSLH